MAAKKQADRVVYIYVVGDSVHIGHLHDLQQARALGDYLIMSVIADKGITDYKRRPVILFKERLELDANPRCVDEVVRLDGVGPTENRKKLDVDILVHGDF